MMASEPTEAGTFNRRRRVMVAAYVLGFRAAPTPRRGTPGWTGYATTSSCG